MYLRFAALGDSTTFGIGDPVPSADGLRWRGWAALLAEALAGPHDVSFCNLSVPGATSLTVRYGQLDEAVRHRPDLASLVVGVNDTMRTGRSGWDPSRIRRILYDTAARLAGDGALLLTARFHDHGAVWGLPGPLRRPLFARIEQVNEVYDELHQRFGTVQIDLAARPEIHERSFWSVDRLHPSELGHRALARAYAAELRARGIDCPDPSAEPDSTVVPSWRDDVRWMVTEGAPWVGRRARDLGPWAARLAVAGALRPAVRPAVRPTVRAR